MRPRSTHLGDRLVAFGTLSFGALADALGTCDAAGVHALLDTVVATGEAHESALCAQLAAESGQPVAVLSSSIIDVTLCDEFPREILHAHRLLPLGASAEQLWVAMARPDAHLAAGCGTGRSGRTVMGLLALEPLLDRTLATVLDAARRGEPLWLGPASPALPHPRITVMQPPRRSDAEVDALLEKLLRDIADSSQHAHVRGKPIARIELVHAPAREKTG